MAAAPSSRSESAGGFGPAFSDPSQHHPIVFEGEADKVSRAEAKPAADLNWERDLVLLGQLGGGKGHCLLHNTQSMADGSLGVDLSARLSAAGKVGAMNGVALKDAKLNLEQLVPKVIANAEPTIVVTESGEQVVFLPLDEYNSWKETLYLLASPANAEHLQRSISEVQAGDVHERELLEA
jgi:antitoxin YefM